MRIKLIFFLYLRNFFDSSENTYFPQYILLTSQIHTNVIPDFTANSALKSLQNQQKIKMFSCQELEKPSMNFLIPRDQTPTSKHNISLKFLSFHLCLVLLELSLLPLQRTNEFCINSFFLLND